MRTHCFVSYKKRGEWRRRIYVSDSKLLQIGLSLLFFLNIIAPGTPPRLGLSILCYTDSLLTDLVVPVSRGQSYNS